MADDGTVWLELNGRAWHVEVGTAEHANLVKQNAVEIDEPAEAKPARTKAKPADKGDEA